MSNGDTHIKRKKEIIWSFVVGLFFLALFSGTSGAAATPADSADRAVAIAKKSREKVERSGKLLQTSSRETFRAFAESTAELQKLIDTRDQLEQAGLLSKDDPQGRARRAHINARILTEVGSLKSVTDKHLDKLLAALDSFDRAVAESVIDTQATRSINSNYEVALDRYLNQEQTAFKQVAKNAEEALDAYQSADHPEDKRRLKKKYSRIKKRLLKINQRRKLYESRIAAARMNQQLTGLIRDKIRRDGGDIPDKFRNVMTDLYTVYAKIVPVAEAGGTGSPDFLTNMGFANISQLNETLGIVEDATAKLNRVLDGMVDNVLEGLGAIQVVDEAGMTGDVFSVEDEMDFIYSQKEKWNQS